MAALTLLLLCIFFSVSVKEVCMVEDDYEEDEDQNCPITESIAGGNVSYSQAGTQGSVLTYHCQAGHYPYPVSRRECGPDGTWSAMRLVNGRRVSRAACKEVHCPGQLQLDHGMFWPREQWLKPGESQSFSCQSGYTLSGSAQRNCTVSGDWTGTSPVCDDQADYCKNPGVPPGALRSGSRFRVDEKVRYRCQMGLDLLGSAERVCLDSREWSGSEIRCQAQYAFDSPSVVAEAMGGALSGVMDVLSTDFRKQKKGYGRFLQMADGRMNVYVLMDTSGSISESAFNHSRNATADLIRKLDSYDITMRFQVISYASEPIVLVSIHEEFASGNMEAVIKRLYKFNHAGHGKKKGTNLYAALNQVYESIGLLKEKEKNKFNETQNVIIIQTDGYSNTGGSPMTALSKIRSQLGYSHTTVDHTEEKLLDVYVFGIGENVNKKELNLIASHKRQEQHLFILMDYKQLGEVFNSIISDKSVVMCGVAQEDVSDENEDPQEPKKTAYTRPWHVIVKTTKDEIPRVGMCGNCQGSIVNEKWILTAAHCFHKVMSEGNVDPKDLTVKHSCQTKELKVLSVIVHPLFNISGLSDKNVTEFYDYDIALIKVEKIKLSWTARPICLPCTVAANRAMKKSNSSTCQDHQTALLPMEVTKAYFINKGSLAKEAKQKQTHILTGTKRADCVKPAEKYLTTPHTTNLDEYVPENFLCSGGSANHVDAVTCKGDSGGALFVRNRMRYFQVGVVSWGTLDVCKSNDMRDRPDDARDFHISLFQLAPWLKEHLGEDLEFLPMGS